MQRMDWEGENMFNVHFDSLIVAAVEYRWGFGHMRRDKAPISG